MKHYIKETAKGATDWTEFKKLFPIEKNRQSLKFNSKNGKLLTLKLMTQK